MIAIITAILYSVSTYFIITVINKDDSSNNIISQTVNISSDSYSTVSSSQYGSLISSSVMSTENGTMSSADSSLNQSDVSSDESSVIGSTSNGSTSNGSTSSITSNSSSQTQIPANKSFSSAMWFSFGEDMNFKGLNEQQSKLKVDKMFDNAVYLGNDAVICQIRPFADAYYKSSIFPWSVYLTGTQGKDPGYDPMKYLIEAAHKRGLQFHAWLNPYRISTSTNDPNTLSSDHIARKWWNDPTKKRNVLVWGNGIYFNPTVTECQQLIISGVAEILENYNVDGIHIDDYFYPTDDTEFDKEEYLAYQLTASKPLSQADWRRQNVNTLVQGIWREVHKHNGITFGISPSYHISSNGTDDNYTKKFADLAKWMNTSGYIDYIAPQIYFGYTHSSADFTKVLNNWLSIKRRIDIKIYIGLAAYKIGKLDETYKPTPNTEWQTETDILAKQTLEAHSKKCDGVYIFNYSKLFAETNLAKTQLSNLKEVLKSIK